MNKCICGKLKGEHQAVTLACPVGRKHRTVGWTQFSKDHVFTVDVKGLKIRLDAMDVAVTKIFKKSKFVTDPVTDPHRDTCNKPAGRVSKILGGGDSWYYVFCGCGRQLGAAHEDDKEGMAHLRKIASNE